MRLFILGATGRTGSQLVQLGLERGHELTAFVRSPDKITARPAGLHVVAGDPLDPQQLMAALRGHDAVLSSLGPPASQALRSCTLMTRAATSTVTAMLQADVRRLVIASAAVLFPERGLYYAFFRWLLRHHARDLAGMERVVRDSGLAWTIARPPRLSGSADAHYVSRHDGMPGRSRVLSFRGMAAFMLDCAEEDSHTRAVVGVSRGAAA